jgi:sucrose phosphorylase
MTRIRRRFAHLYGEERSADCIERLEMLIGRYGVGITEDGVRAAWDENDTLLITYGDMIRRQGEAPLKTLKLFADEHLAGAISTIHILPFFPYSSDDGFSIIDYREVNRDFGNWQNIEALREHFSLMFDLVLNHVSRSSEWFDDYVAGVAPARHYFLEVSPDTDLSSVVRPRSTPLLTDTQTRQGERHLWATFSEDQLDLNFANPDVLFEFFDILLSYIAHGARFIRLDAIAYLWKEIGTSCIHLPQTHEVVKLMRDLLYLAAPETILLTETNVPHKENVSYFGDGDEAQMVYQFTLPPLLMYSLVTGDASHLTRWAAELEPPPEGCTFLNFTASHDGIGVRPLEGIISNEELEGMLAHVRERGGQVSTKRNQDGSESPYELNITYFDVLGRPGDSGIDEQIARFLCSQTIALELRGIPAVYFNSLIGAPNHIEGVERTGRARTINRQKWGAAYLEEQLSDADSTATSVFQRYTQLLQTRRTSRAFHPDADQEVFDLGPAFFALQRTAPDKDSTVVCISNMTNQQQSVTLDHAVPYLEAHDQWRDLLSDKIRGGKSHTLRMQPYETVWLTAAD